MGGWIYLSAEVWSPVNPRMDGVEKDDGYTTAPRGVGWVERSDTHRVGPLPNSCHFPRKVLSSAQPTTMDRATPQPDDGHGRNST
jgi:hypothetical protein